MSWQWSADLHRHTSQFQSTNFHSMTKTSVYIQTNYECILISEQSIIQMKQLCHTSRETNQIWRDRHQWQNVCFFVSQEKPCGDDLQDSGCYSEAQQHLDQASDHIKRKKCQCYMDLSAMQVTDPLIWTHPVMNMTVQPIWEALTTSSLTPKRKEQDNQKQHKGTRQASCLIILCQVSKHL